MQKVALTTMPSSVDPSTTGRKDLELTGLPGLQAHVSSSQQRLRGGSNALMVGGHRQRYV